MTFYISMGKVIILMQVAGFSGTRVGTDFGASISAKVSIYNPRLALPGGNAAGA
jgi:hypothetical protein